MNRAPIPASKLRNLYSFLENSGPYSRDQLRIKLLKAAEACRDDAEFLRHRPATFVTSVAVSSCFPIALTGQAPRTAETWDALAAEFTAMAERVSAYTPGQTRPAEAA